MKIESLQLHHLSMPLVAPFETSFGRSIDRECIIVTLKADGLEGFGECVADRDPGYCYETTRTAWHILKDFIAPALLGQEVGSAVELQARLDFIRGHPLAKAGVEMALWDLIGKREGRSLRDMLGGVRENVAVGVSVGIQESPATLVKVVADYLADGYGRIKIKIKPGRDLEETRAVRQAFPGILLQVDANSAYALKDTDRLRMLDAFNLLLIEQPLEEDDLWDHARLQANLKTAICLDESILSARHARAALEMKACRIINIKAGRVGGLQQARMIHDLCSEQDVPVWCGGMLETGLGRAANLALASLPGFNLPGDISASARYYAQDITEERFTLNPDSTITVPGAPGVGVHIDAAALKHFTQASEEIRG